MTNGMNFTGVHSRRKLGRGLDWIIELFKMILTLAFIIAGLSVALWTTLGINPLKELIK